MNRLCYINGEFLPAGEGRIGISDLAVQRGYGVFDFGRTFNNKLFHFEENIRRFRASARALRLEIPATDEEILSIANRLIDESDLQIPAVRLLLTGGYEPDLSEPNFIMIAEELPQYPADLFSGGVKIITMEFQRELPEIKSINYLNAIRIEPIKEERGAFDVLYHWNGNVTECPRNNFFAFFGDTLVTPGEDVLLGVTRNIVLRLAAEQFEVEERKLGLGELRSADEAFVTSTSKGVMPVTVIDSEQVGDGKVGSRTQILKRLFEEYAEAY